MIRNEPFAKAIQVLSCLAVAFALVFFPPNAAHAAAKVHGGHSAIEQGKTSSVQAVHSHSAQMDCGSNKTATSTADAGVHQCCAGMCLAAILIDVFTSPQTDASAIALAAPHTLPIAAVSHGFLRPPKHLA
jgi:hypothetical protein